MTIPAEFIRTSDGWYMIGLASGVATTETPWLPFDMPTRETLFEGPGSLRKVFAHYFTQFPVRINDRALSDPAMYEKNLWLPPGAVERTDNPATPQDETIDHRAYGGWTRDLYLDPAASRPRGSNFRYLDSVDEIIAAQGAGLDGFTVDLLASSTSPSQHWPNFTTMISAAEASSGFLIVPMPDGNTGFTDSRTQMVADLLSVADSPALWRIAGQLVVAPYAPEGVGSGPAADVLDFWTRAQADMAAAGVPFLQWNVYSALWDDTGVNYKTANLLDLISHGHGRWGARYYTGTEGDTAWIAKCHNTYGKPAMHYASPQDTRPKSAKYWEARGTRAFRGAWMTAINGGADVVQVPTWNDLSESANVMPSRNSGYCWLDLLAYYISWYKLGYPQPIVRDAIYLTHRIHHTSVTAVSSTQTSFQVRQTSAVETNFVEALCFLTEAATIEIDVCGTVTTVDVAAGLQSVEAPLPPGVAGTVSARAVRSAVTVDGTEVVSPYPVVTMPVSQDLQYRISSSLRPVTSQLG